MPAYLARMALHELISSVARRRLSLGAYGPKSGRPGPPPRPAEPMDIAAAERRLGFALPSSYAEFLRLQDGWPDFAFGANLFGTAQLGKASYVSIARMIVEDFADDLEHGPPSIVARASSFVPFGMNEYADIVVGWDGAKRASGDELRVVLWMNGIGETLGNFKEFLQYMIEMIDAELSAAEMCARPPKIFSPAQGAPRNIPMQQRHDLLGRP